MSSEQIFKFFLYNYISFGEYFIPKKQFEIGQYSNNILLGSLSFEKTNEHPWPIRPPLKNSYNISLLFYAFQIWCLPVPSPLCKYGFIYNSFIFFMIFYVKIFVKLKKVDSSPEKSMPMIIFYSHKY